jgi:type IV pilus assembly protein PilY1
MSNSKLTHALRGWRTVLPLTAFAACANFAFALPAQVPPSITASAPPAVLLTMGKDHKLFYEAYNDASDIDGNGSIDTRYKPEPKIFTKADGTTSVEPGITYFGLFDSYKCYTYNSGAQYFEPVSFTADKKCSGQWSGDFLNYLTTTRIDALRRVMYGGMRSTDTATATVLERAYIPQDAHSFGKEWWNGATSATIPPTSNSSHFNLSDYAPSSAVPAAGAQVFFANVTLLVSSSRADLTAPPLLRVAFPPLVTNRIWDWLSKERPVAGSTLFSGATITATDYVVRVKVCVAGLLEQDCVGYPAGAPTVYKPTGILHEFGQDNQMHFGLLSGSYDNNNDGGVLRKNVSAFSDEIDLSTGVFKSTATGIVHNINRFRVESFVGGLQYACGWVITDPQTSGQNCSDWGNPIAEMMYEGLRYFSGKASPTSEFVSNGSAKDTGLGLTRPTWVDPYRTPTKPTGLPYCSKPVQMVISDIYTSFDSDKVPGSDFGNGFSGDLPGLSSSAIANSISSKEGIGGSAGINYFIGQSGTGSGAIFDKIPSAKPVAGFGSIRGLAPEEPTRGGSYLSAAVAHYGKGTDMRTDLVDQGWAQTVDTYSIALASPLPKISIPIGNPETTTQFVELIPFGKSVGGYGIPSAESSYQPTNQIVDFYIERIVNQKGFETDASINGGRPFGRFRINFEDVEQGADHDMDAIATYEYEVLADGRVRITVDAGVYAAGSIKQHMGYILAGVTGTKNTFLVVRDADTAATDDVNYYLDTKPTDGSYDAFVGLPLRSVETYTPAVGSSARYIPHNPLWYAAKYGGYPEKRDSTGTRPTATGTNGNIELGWDKRKSGQPDSYFLVTNAGTLREQLRRAFLEIQSRNESGTAATTGTSALTSKSRAFEASFNSKDWTGEVKGYSVNKNGARNLIWETSDTTSFPTNRSTRKVITSWNGASYQFNTTGADALPPASKASFNLTALDSLLKDDVSLNWSTRTPLQKENIAFDILVDYIRGDQKKEKGNTTGTLRPRSKLLGDIVNSNAVYATNIDYGFSSLPGDEGSSYAAYVDTKANDSSFKTVYVGANDGMLHAFNADTGFERFAYVPGSIYSRLHKLAVPGYQHEYFVDGRLVISDAYRPSGGGGWTSVLLGSTGAGGRSVFALDIRNPNGDKSNVLWEFTDPDLGYPIGIPAIGRTAGATGRWVAMFANGYFGSGRKASLFVLDLFTGAKLQQIDFETTSAQNGLGSLSVYENRGVIQHVYAGDLLGQLWKVNATSPTPSSWTIANSGLPLFKATGPDGNVQPITAQPSVSTLGRGTQVFFGTGKLIESADRFDTSVQSVYGLWLQTDPGETLTRSKLVRQTIVAQTESARALSDNLGTGNEWGWVVDLQAPGSGAPTGERVISTTHFSFGTVDWQTWYIGEVNACEPGGQSWLMSVSGDSGRAKQPLFDITGDNRINSSDKIAGKNAAGVKVKGSIADPLINFTPDDSTDTASKGTYDLGTGTLSNPSLAAGTCPPCSKWIGSGTATSGSTNCRRIPICSTDSWTQIQ